jgi:uncharacterized SAM-binding protein YcdF (DUF218 family)
MLYLDKIIWQLATPLASSLLLAFVALLLLGMRRYRLGPVLLVIAISWLGLWSLPVVSDAMRASLESRFVNESAGRLPQADAIVVLGGGMRAVPPAWPYPDLNSAADRVWHAARLYKLQKAPRIIASGGLVWENDHRPEAEVMQEFLLDLGVPAAAILLERRSRNTRENAVFTAQLLQAQGIARVLLVTSALHMPRALAAFHAAGIDAIAAPTDFEVVPAAKNPLRWLPDADALEQNTRALKEYLGYWVYRWRGWAA